jgi:hypothetical protein
VIGSKNTQLTTVPSIYSADRTVYLKTIQK